MSTADVGAGRLVLWAKAGVGAVATQSWPNLYLAIDAIRLMESGTSAPKALDTVLEADPDKTLRQLGIVDHAGMAAAWSGSDCTDSYGDVVGNGFAAQGNMLVSSRTVEALAATFKATEGLVLAERLLRCLEAAQSAGGDKRGRQCSALLVVDREEFPLWDLRADEHPNPVAELRRIYEIARHQLLPFVEGLPTRTNSRGSLSEGFIEMNLRPPPERPGGGGAGPWLEPDAKRLNKGEDKR